MTRAKQTRPKANARRTAVAKPSAKTAMGINRIVVTDGNINARATPRAKAAAGAGARPAATSGVSRGVNRIVVTGGKINARVK